LAHLAGNLDVAVQQYRRSAEIQESLGAAGVIESLVKLGAICVIKGDFGGLEQALHRIETGGRSSARAPWEGHIAVARLAVVAYRRDWSSWAGRLSTAQTEWERALATSDAFATFARVAGDLATAAGMGEQARAAYLLAEGPGPSKGEMPAFTIVDGMLSRLPKLG
jgi:hypothetical protein